MKKTKKAVLVMALILGFTATVKSEVITIFDSDTTISAGDTYDTVVVRGDGTVVDMNGGSITKLFVMNNCTINMSGGNTSQISSHDSSTVNIFGDAYIGNSSISGKSKANFYGNSEAVSVSCYSYAEITIAEDANIPGSLYVYDNCKVFISGGSVKYIIFRNGNTEVFISGGNFTSIANFSGASNRQDKVHIIGYGLEAKPYGGPYGDGVVSGYWNDDSPFTLSFFEPHLYDIITLYDGIIPLNCINPPESDLSGDCVVNFIDLTKMSSEWLEDGTQ